MPEIKLGVISDTHGLLRPEAKSALEGLEHILHIGDVGSEKVWQELNVIAPVTAVKGNVDKGDWAKTLPLTEVFSWGESHVYLLHDLSELDLDPAAAGFQVVLSGHSHRPVEEFKDGVLYLNPGSAGPFRFRLPCTMAYLFLSETEKPRVQWIELVER